MLDNLGLDDDNPLNYPYSMIGHSKVQVPENIKSIFDNNQQMQYKQHQENLEYMK
jgi:hypothetical protein